MSHKQAVSHRPSQHSRGARWSLAALIFPTQQHRKERSAAAMMTAPEMIARIMAAMMRMKPMPYIVIPAILIGSFAGGPFKQT